MSPPVLRRPQAMVIGIQLIEGMILTRVCQDDVEDHGDVPAMCLVDQQRRSFGVP